MPLEMAEWVATSVGGVWPLFAGVISNSTSGIEPPRGLITSKSGDFKIVPDYKKYKNYYTTAWGDDFDNIEYFKFCAVLQKWEDQTISLNQYLNLIKTSGKVKKTRLIEEVMCARYYGLKTMYYSNIISTETKDGDDDIIVDDEPESCSGGGCMV